MSLLPTLDLTPAPLREHLPQAGSELYYALLYQPRETRAALTLIEALRHTLTAVPLGSSRPEIAEARLAWWHEELHSLEGAAVRHPLLRAIQPLVRSQPELLPALFTLVEGVGRQLAHPRYVDVQERQRLLVWGHGPLWRIHGRVCGLHDEQHLDSMATLGALIELAWLLRDLRRAITGGLSVISRDHEPAAGHRGDDEAFYSACLKQELPWLLKALATAREAVTGLPVRGRQLRCMRTLALLTEHTLREILADGAQTWSRRIELTPLRKLLLALRVRVST